MACVYIEIVLDVQEDFTEDIMLMRAAQFFYDFSRIDTSAFQIRLIEKMQLHAQGRIYELAARDEPREKVGKNDCPPK